MPSISGAQLPKEFLGMISNYHIRTEHFMRFELTVKEGHRGDSLNNLKFVRVELTGKDDNPGDYPNNYNPCVQAGS